MINPLNDPQNSTCPSLFAAIPPARFSPRPPMLRFQKVQIAVTVLAMNMSCVPTAGNKPSSYWSEVL
ncbi:MAG: hypothetical protein IPI41_05455 [Flavobacteriales bacterium]|nr:hypothetical protein [Flavobacteriales bacterium]